jgi:hypothetical protein
MLQDDDDAISGSTRTLVLEFGFQFLQHPTVTVCTDCVVITWFEVRNWGLCKTWNNTLYIISTWISVVKAKSSVSTKCLPIFLWVVGYATSHRLQYVTEMHHPTSGTMQDFPWYWHAILFWYVSQCGTQWECALWYPGYHTVTLSMITLMFNSNNREQTVERPVHNYNIINSCNILQTSDHVSLSCSWYVCCSLLARSKQTAPV